MGFMAGKRAGLVANTFPIFHDDPGNGRFFAGGAGDRMMFDLPGYGLHRLRAAGGDDLLHAADSGRIDDFIHGGSRSANTYIDRG